METDIGKILREWSELLFPLLIFGGIYLVRFFRTYRQARGLREIAPLLNGEAVLRPFFTPAIKGIYMGHSFRMSFFPAGRNSPGRLQILFEFPCSAHFEVVARGRTPGVQELLGRKSNVAVAEEAFNASVTVRADRDREKAALYLDNPGNRGLILELVDRGFSSIRFTGQGVVLSKAGDFLGKEGITAEKAMEYLTFAGRLVERI